MNTKFDFTTQGSVFSTMAARLFLMIAFITLFSVSCKKDGFLSEIRSTKLSEVERQFFDPKFASLNNPFILQTATIRSKQETIQNVLDTVLAQNQQQHFVSDLVHILGFPVWNQSQVLGNSHMAEDYMVVTPFTKLTDSTVTGFLLATKRLQNHWSFVLVDREGLESLTLGTSNSQSDSIIDHNNDFFALQIFQFDRDQFGVLRPLISTHLTGSSDNATNTVSDRTDPECYLQTAISDCIPVVYVFDGPNDQVDSRSCPPGYSQQTEYYMEFAQCEPGGGSGGGGWTGGGGVTGGGGNVGGGGSVIDTFPPQYNFSWVSNIFGSGTQNWWSTLFNSTFGPNNVNGSEQNQAQIQLNQILDGCKPSESNPVVSGDCTMLQDLMGIKDFLLPSQFVWLWNHPDIMYRIHVEAAIRNFKLTDKEKGALSAIQVGLQYGLPGIVVPSSFTDFGLLVNLVVGSHDLKGGIQLANYCFSNNMDVNQMKTIFGHLGYLDDYQISTLFNAQNIGLLTTDILPFLALHNDDAESHAVLMALVDYAGLGMPIGTEIQTEDFPGMFIWGPEEAAAAALSYALNKANHPDWSEAHLILQAGYDALKGTIHTAADIVGLVPGFGEAADAFNGFLYVCEGDDLNAGLSFAAMLPIAGWASTGKKWAGVLFEYGGKSRTLNFRLANGVVEFGPRSNLRKVMGITNSANEAHHIIPWQLRSHELSQYAAHGNYHFNHPKNGLELPKIRDDFPDGVHGSHPAYNTKVNSLMDQLWGLLNAKYPNGIPLEVAKDKLVQLQDNIAAHIDANPSKKINLLTLSDVQVPPVP